MKIVIEWQQVLSFIAKRIRQLLEKIYIYSCYATQRIAHRSGLPTFRNPALLVALNIFGKHVNVKQKYFLNHLQSVYFGAIQMAPVLGSSIVSEILPQK